MMDSIRKIMNKKINYFLICSCAGIGFVCGVVLSKMVDILQEIKIANIVAVGIMTSVALFASITWCFERLITWKCLRSRILKKDICYSICFYLFLDAISRISSSIFLWIAFRNSYYWNCASNQRFILQ